MDPTKNILNVETLDDLKRIDPGLPQEMIAIYQNSSPSIINEIEVFFRKDEIENLCKKVHFLKSTCGNVGLLGMAKLCEEIEILGEKCPKKTKSLIAEKIKIIKNSHLLAVKKLKLYLGQ